MNATKDPQAPARLLLRQLRRPTASGLESAGPAQAPSQARVEEGLERLDVALARAQARLGPSASDLKAKVMSSARSGLGKLAEAGAQARLAPLEQAAVEAVIHVDGSRPVLFIRDGVADARGESLGEWARLIDLHATSISEVVASVGRIGVRQSRFRYQGTGFVVGDGLLLTNRHVLQLIGVEETPGVWSLYPDATIDFAAELTDPGVSPHRDMCPLEEVVFCGPEPILGIDLDRLDLALLRFSDSPEGHKPLAIASTANRLWPEAPLYTVGFPAAADVFYGDGTPSAGAETVEVMTSIFHDQFGVKRLAPGRVDAAPGECLDHGRDWVFEHDASTLGGNSGSAVIDFADGARAVGLHFGGGPRRTNYAHVLANLRAQLSNFGVNYV